MKISVRNVHGILAVLSDNSIIMLPNTCVLFLFWRTYLIATTFAPKLLAG